MYCLYTVIKSTGRKVDFRTLLKPKYIGSRRGSSLAELQRAAEDSGLYAACVGGLTTRSLRSVAQPVILHVKSDITSREYDHYELFLGTETGLAKVFNPPEPLRLVPFQELGIRWDGSALIVSDKPINLAVVFGAARMRLILYAAVGIAVVAIAHLARSRWFVSAAAATLPQLWVLSVAQAAGLVAAALFCGLTRNFANNEGLLANTAAVASIQRVHTGNFIPKITERTARRLLDAEGVFIDARLSDDFDAGHLKGAINVPVDANDVQRRAKTAGIAKDAPIVVYCQSSGCKFADNVAVKLRYDGFSNILIFRGGWTEWVAKHHGLIRATVDTQNTRGQKGT